MRKIFYCFLAFACVIQMNAGAQSRCGFDDQIKGIIAQNPAFAEHTKAWKASLQPKANLQKQIKSNANKATYFAAAVPVIFHYIIDSAQYNSLGGLAGIKQRLDSQMVVLNRDFNAQNPDSVLIPSGWKSLFGSTGITFGLARKDPWGNPCYGYDLHISTTPFAGFNMGSASYDKYSDAKHNATGGVDAWDVTKYLNVWCINFADNTGLLGITITKLMTPSGGAPTPCPLDNEQGICMNYSAVGKRASISDNYPGGGTRYDEGRTLTHEAGHIFELWHVWGDDGGLCPWNGGYDDGIQDTPPQGNYTNGNPVYNVPNGTVYDGCKDSSGVNLQTYGIACLDFLDYTDDGGMHLFTTDQAAEMVSNVTGSGENVGLVSNPDLTAAVPELSIESKIGLMVMPNPTTGIVNISFDNANEALLNLSVVNILGQEVKQTMPEYQAQQLIVLNLKGFEKGIYFVKCTFASGTVCRKIILQ